MVFTGGIGSLRSHPFRVRGGQDLKILLKRFDTFDFETDMVESRTRVFGIVIVFDLPPRQD